MPIYVHHLRSAWTLLFFWGCLTGCAMSKTPATRFYILTPVDFVAVVAASDETERPVSVELVSLRLPQYLERPQIVTRSSVNRLELAEYDQWGGNLRKNMIRVLADNLSRILDTPDIVISPHRPSGFPDFRVEVEVMQFERFAHGKIRLSAHWRLSKGRDRTTLGVNITHLVSPVIPAQADYIDTVSAMSELFGELSQTIGQEILRIYRGGSAS